MKIRTGLVSNSSSTSFAIYGLQLEEQLEYKEVLEKIEKGPYSDRFSITISDDLKEEAEDGNDISSDLLFGRDSVHFKTLEGSEIRIIYVYRHRLIGFGYAKYSEETIILNPKEVGDLFEVLSFIFRDNNPQIRFGLGRVYDW